MATTDSKFNDLDALGSDEDDGSNYTGTDSELEEEEKKLNQEMEKLKKKKEETAGKVVALDRNSQIEAKHSKAMIAFGPVWLIAPFIPLFEALATIMFGSITMNTTNASECTEPLHIYTGGQIFLAYIYVIGYGSVFIGFGSLKWTNMFTYKLVAAIYGGLAIVWNIFGTAVLSSADACKVITPELYSLGEWQVLMFWITLSIYILSLIRAQYMKRFANQRARRAAQADRIRKLEEEDRMLKKKAKEEEEARRQEEAEQEAEEEARRLAKEAEDAKKRALAEQYGVDSDDSSAEESDDDLAATVPGAANPTT